MYAILSYKNIFVAAFSVISENLVKQFFRKFQKTVILGQTGHLLAHLAKFDQNVNCFQK